MTDELEAMRAKVRRLRSEVMALDRQIADAEIAASPIKVGDRYRNRRGVTAEVVRKTHAYGGVVGVLALHNKNGLVGLRRSDTSSWNGWQKE